MASLRRLHVVPNGDLDAGAKGLFGVLGQARRLGLVHVFLAAVSAHPRRKVSDDQRRIAPFQGDGCRSRTGLAGFLVVGHDNIKRAAPARSSLCDNGRYPAARRLTSHHTAAAPSIFEAVMAATPAAERNPIPPRKTTLSKGVETALE